MSVQTLEQKPWEGPVHPPTAVYFFLVHALGLLGVVYAGYVVSAIPYGWVAVAILLLFLVGYFFLGQIATTITAHRWLAHSAFKMVVWLQYVLLLQFSSNAQGSAICWSGWHRKHHAKEDTEEDPHSPLFGFWWSHMMWIIRNGGFTMPENRYVVTQSRNTAARFQHEYYFWLQIVMAWGIPTFVGYLAGSLIDHALVGVLMGFLMANTRLVPQYHLTWIINSACHTWGHSIEPRTATNIPWLAILTAGESNHAEHHAAPAHYRIGRKEGQYDMGAWVLKRFEKLGWVWDLKTT